MWTINNRKKCQNTKTMLYSKIKSLMIDHITKQWDNIPLCHHVKMELQVYIYKSLYSVFIPKWQ